MKPKRCRQPETFESNKTDGSFIVRQGHEKSMKSLEEFITAFITNIEVKGIRSISTVRNYKMYLYKFLDFTGNIALADLNIETVDRWHKHLLDKGLSQKTCGFYLIGIRSFLKWMVQRNIKPPILSEQIEVPKTHRILKDIPSVDEIRRLLVAANLRFKKNWRDRAILEMLISSGLRVSELISIKTDEVDFTNNRITIVGKGEKERLVFFSQNASDLIRKYLENRKHDSPFLFTQRKNGNSNPVTPRLIQRVIKKYSKMAGIKTNIYPHLLRHFYACYLLEKGVDLFSIKELLGHSSIQTTNIYLHKNNEQLGKAYNKAFGFSEPFIKRHRSL